MRSHLTPSRLPHRYATSGGSPLSPSSTATQPTSGRRFVVRPTGGHTSELSTRPPYDADWLGSRQSWSGASRGIPVTLLGQHHGSPSGYRRTLHGRPHPRTRSAERKTELFTITAAKRPWEGGVPTVAHLQKLLRTQRQIREDYGMTSDYEAHLRECIWEAYDYLRAHDRDSLKQLERQQFFAILSVAAAHRHRFVEKREENVWAVVDDMKILRGYELGIEKYEAAIATCRGRREAVRMSMALLDKAVHAGFRPTLQTYNQLLRVRIDAEGARSGEEWWESLEGKINVNCETRGFVPLRRDIVTANHILLGYMKERDIARGWEFYRGYSKFSFEANDDTRNHLLFGYAKTNDRVSLERILDEMLASGHKLNYEGYCIAIYGFSKTPMDADEVDPDAERYLRRAMDAYDQLLKAGYRPGAKVYSSLMSLQLKRGNVDKLRDSFADMQKGGVVPDLACYILLLRSYIFDFDMTSAQSIFDRLLESGVVTGTRAFTVMMAGYVKADKPDRAVDLFSDAMARGFNPDENTFTTLMNAYCEMGDMDKAYATMDDMEERGIRATERVHLTLLRGHGLVRDLEGAEKIFGIVEPSTRAYNYMMTACVRCEAHDRALQYYAEMTRRSIEPNLSTFNILIQTKTKLKDVGGAKDILRSLVQQRLMPTPYSIVPIMHHHATKGQVEEVSEYWNLLGKLTRPADMVADKYEGGVRAQSEARASNHVLLAMTNAKDLHGAVRHFRDVDTDRDAITFDILVRAHGVVGDLVGARRLLDEALEKGILVDTRLWNSLLRVHLQEGDHDGVFDLLKEMQRRGHTPDMFTYTLVLKAKLAQKALEREAAEQRKLNEGRFGSAADGGTDAGSHDLDAEFDDAGAASEGKAVRQLSSFGEIPDLPDITTAGEEPAADSFTHGN
ncbi:hypothetical protein HK097_007051 [Rhizophlyctis rosea]|uniref:Pentacotripeptide-repeat region of PRORP domain-containing protein n=1 Tax=Rhizophlyctis rosea TaxID=64517 RepID=A0AAD5X2I3_9FUNG|nr:hypothetical protein HK097_007051 [Rhizophlyctis rosea]